MDSFVNSYLSPIDFISSFPPKTRFLSLALKAVADASPLIVLGSLLTQPNGIQLYP